MTLKVALSPDDQGAKRLGGESVGMEHMLEVQYHSIESFADPLQLIAKDNMDALREITPAQIRHAAQPARFTA